MKGNTTYELKENNLIHDLDDLLKNDFESLSPQYDYDTLNMIGATIDTAIMNLEKDIHTHTQSHDVQQVLEMTHLEFISFNKRKLKKPISCVFSVI